MRILTIDLLKVVSIFFVIVSHVTLFFLSSNNNDVFICLFRQSGQLGVALFFMCSGYFLLNNKHENQVDYILKKVKIILGVLLFWIVFYYMYDAYFISKFTTVPVVNFFKFFNVSDNLSDASHLWFIFAIIGIYILTPLFHTSFTEKNANGILKLLIIMLIISNLTLVNALTDYEYSFKTIPLNVLLPFQSQGLISFLIGGYLGMSRPKIRSFSLTHTMLLIFSVSSFIALSIITSRIGMTFFYGKFYNPLLQVSSVCLFLFIVNISISRMPSMFDDISKNVLGIYLTHNIFVVELHSEFIHNKILKTIGEVNIYLYIITYSLIAFILSYVLCNLLRRSKIIAKIITL